MKLIKEIKSKSGIVHFKRWKILSLPWLSIYIHGIYKADTDKDLHNHPWSIWTMIIRGAYIEELHNDFKCLNSNRLRSFGHMAYCDTSKFHKIQKLLSEKVYTIAIVGKRQKYEWGYITDDGFIDHIKYRKMKNENL